MRSRKGRRRFAEPRGTVGKGLGTEQPPLSPGHLHDVGGLRGREWPRGGAKGPEGWTREPARSHEMGVVEGARSERPGGGKAAARAGGVFGPAPQAPPFRRPRPQSLSRRAASARPTARLADRAVLNRPPPSPRPPTARRPADPQSHPPSRRLVFSPRPGEPGAPQPCSCYTCSAPATAIPSPVSLLCSQPILYFFFLSVLSLSLFFLTLFLSRFCSLQTLAFS